MRVVRHPDRPPLVRRLAGAGIDKNEEEASVLRAGPHRQRKVHYDDRPTKAKSGLSAVWKTVWKYPISRVL